MGVGDDGSVQFLVRYFDAKSTWCANHRPLLCHWLPAVRLRLDAELLAGAGWIHRVENCMHIGVHCAIVFRVVGKRASTVFRVVGKRASTVFRVVGKRASTVFAFNVLFAERLVL